MSRSDILVPVILEKDSMEGLKFAAHLAGEFSIHATLLHVVELNIFPLDRRVYDEVCFEYQQRLENIAGCLPGKFRRLCVRIGKPHEEIAAEARDSKVELIVMSAPKSKSRRLPLRLTNVERVVRDASCQALVISEPWRTAAAQYKLPVSLFDRTHQEVMVE